MNEVNGWEWTGQLPKDSQGLEALAPGAPLQFRQRQIGEGGFCLMAKAGRGKKTNETTYSAVGVPPA